MENRPHSRISGTLLIADSRHVSMTMIGRASANDRTAASTMVRLVAVREKSQNYSRKEPQPIVQDGNAAANPNGYERRNSAPFGSERRPAQRALRRDRRYGHLTVACRG